MLSRSGTKHFTGKRQHLMQASKYAAILASFLAILFLACGSPAPEPIVRIPSDPPTQAPLPTYTPYPTYTPFPTPVHTHTPLPTNTPEPPTQPPLPTYTPYPTYTPLLTPVPTHTPLPTHTPTPGNTPTPTMTLTPTITPTPTPTITPTPTPTITPTPTPTITPTPTPTITPTLTPTITPTPTPTITPTPTPTITPTPTPTSTMTPTPTPTPGLIDYEELFRNNEEYESRLFRFRGRVIQLIERARNKYDLRVNVDDVWDDSVVYLSAYKGQRLLEGDVIEFVGESSGLYAYEAINRATITIPQLRSVSVVRLSESGFPIPTPTPQPWTIHQNSKYDYRLGIAPGWYLNEETDDGTLVSIETEAYEGATKGFINILGGDVGENVALAEVAEGYLDYIKERAHKESWAMFEMTSSSLERHQHGVHEYYQFRYRRRFSTESCVVDNVDRILLSGSYPSKPYIFVLESSVCEDSLDLYGEERDAMLESFDP